MNDEQRVRVGLDRDHFQDNTAVVRSDISPSLLTTVRDDKFRLNSRHDAPNMSAPDAVPSARGRELDLHLPDSVRHT